MSSASRRRCWPGWTRRSTRPASRRTRTGSSRRRSATAAGWRGGRTRRTRPPTGRTRISRRATSTMSGAGRLLRTLAGKHLEKSAAAHEAFDRGMAAFLTRYPAGGQSEGYLWLVTARLGRTLGSNTFKAGEKELAWYREG